MAQSPTTIPESLRQSHVSLLDDLSELEKQARLGPGANLAQLRERLRATSAHVVEHFRFEEQNGYMDAVRAREPRFERTLQQLAAEHGSLRKSLEELIGAAGAAPSLDEALAGNILSWVEELRRHELRENDLVQEAFDTDISGED